MKVEFYRHTIDEECLREMNAVARNLFITLGPKTGEFEQLFAKYLGLSHAVGVMSCSNALQLSYVALGVGPGDEVIVPALTFAATAFSVLHAGATPVFADVDPVTGLLDPDKTEAAITSRTKAICPVHLYGLMAPMRKFRNIADKHGLLLVEDAAHCMEGRGPGYGPGELSDAVAFSFYATKNITCGEGGAVGTNRNAVAETIGVLRNQGQSKSAVERQALKVETYDIRHLGFKSNMNDLQAALLIPQLRRIEELWEKRRSVARRYDEGLKHVEGVTTPFIPDEHKSARHLYTIRVARNRDEFLARLREEGIGCSIHYRPLSELTFFRDTLGMSSENYPAATSIGQSTISLPLYPSLKDSEVNAVIQSVEKVAKAVL